MVNDLVKGWGPRVKYVDDLTVMEIVPRNSPSILDSIVNDSMLCFTEQHALKSKKVQNNGGGFLEV